MKKFRDVEQNFKNFPGQLNKSETNPEKNEQMASLTKVVNFR